MDIRVSNNRRYEVCDLSQYSDIFEGYYEGYSVDITILKKLAKDLGFSHDLYLTLSRIDKKATEALVTSMSHQSKHEYVLLLLDDDMKAVVGYTLEHDRNPLLNAEFIPRVLSMAEADPDLSVAEVYYSKEDTLASVLLKKKSFVEIEEKHKNSEDVVIKYPVGVLILNDELGNTSTRLVVYSDNGHPMYLPASLYSTTTTRYKRSTPSSLDALEVLVLKVIDDMRGDYLKSKIYDTHFRYRYNKNILCTYEEYSEILKVMRKIPTIIEENSYLDSLLAVYYDYERRYHQLEDHKSSYIWRCTAIGDISIDHLIHLVCGILNDVAAPPIEYFDIREKLGLYISAPRIADDIAKDSTL